jgi:outer membrane murein-binding lipoprotein Lpp
MKQVIGAVALGGTLLFAGCGQQAAQASVEHGSGT